MMTIIIISSSNTNNNTNNSSSDLTMAPSTVAAWRWGRRSSARSPHGG